MGSGLIFFKLYHKPPHRKLAASKSTRAHRGVNEHVIYMAQPALRKGRAPRSQRALRPPALSTSCGGMPSQVLVLNGSAGDGDGTAACTEPKRAWGGGPVKKTAEFSKK